jgi:two-component system response regulator MprA
MQTEAHHPVILVVEDDPAARTLLRVLFSEEGYEVLLAENGAAALVTLATVRPDLITLDLDLPDINGDVVLNVLRAQEATKDVPVAIVSARTAIPADVQAQAQAIIEKPFSIEHLLASIQRLLPPLHALEVGS